MANLHLVFIPATFVGHLFSTIEFAKQLVNRDDRISITVFIMSFPFDKNKKIPFTSTSRIKFVHLTLEPSDVELLLSKPPGDTSTNVIEINKPRIRDYISSEIDHLSAFVVDMFCTQFVDIANEFNVPTYSYFTSSACFLGLIFQLQILADEHNQDIYEFKDSDVELDVISFSNPVPARVLPSDIIDKEKGFPKFLDIPRGLRKIKGILVNTFTELEPYAIKSLNDEKKLPQIYPIGPLLTSIKKHDNASDDDDTNKTRQTLEIMNWLDQQPPYSVVLLCFGSMGGLEKDQVIEIANALEHSGHRFLWALRRPSPKDKKELPSEYENLDDVLPKGFLDRTLGKVVGWIPQMDVLSHPSVGGFVSHCGWNSILESLWCGVPLVTWPLYAEQKFNAFELVKELELAIEIGSIYDKDVVIGSDEIEKGIRLLMDDRDCSNIIRKKVKEMSEKSKASVEIGGSSYNVVGRFIEDFIRN